MASDPILQRGSTGPAVEWLQRRLRIPVDGDFGPITERAVRDYQRKHGLEVDGIVGPQTWAVLKRKAPPGTPPPPKPISEEGVDWAWGEPSVSALKRAGKAFACRYLADVGNSKIITKAQAARLGKGGIKRVLVFELGASRARASKSAGISDARLALEEARHIGAPKDVVIYFAVDFDVGSRPSQVRSYFEGVIAVMGAKRTGVYGNYAVVKYLTEALAVGYRWQTYAWSGGQWYPRAQLQQYSNDHVLDGVGVDYDRTTTTHYGGW